MSKSSIDSPESQSASEIVVHLPINLIEGKLINLWIKHSAGEREYPFQKRIPVVKKAAAKRAGSAAATRGKRPPPWFLGLSPQFSKAIESADSKLQGRILIAISKIAKAPTTPLGDTVKPLSAGKWRFRIADYRLVYAPDRETGNITLLDFASRGSIYEG